MSITTLVREFLGSVSETLQDISPQYSRWPERELVVYANYAQRAIASFLPQAGSAVDAIRLQPGSRQDLTKVLAANIIPGNGDAAADTHGIALLDLVRNAGNNGSTPGRVIRLVDRYTKDTNDPSWHLASKAGTEIREYVTDRATPRVFWTVPPVHASTPVWVDVSWMKEPKAIPAGGAAGAEIYLRDGASTALMGINDQFVEDAQNYVVAMALMKGSKLVQNLPKASAHAQLFVASINSKATQFGATNPNLKALPFADQVPAGA